MAFAFFILSSNLLRWSLDSIFEFELHVLCCFSVGFMHCSGDSQILFSAKTTLKLGPMTLFTHLKIILLQCFQFSVFSNK